MTNIELYTAEGAAPAIRACLDYAMGCRLELWELADPQLPGCFQTCDYSSNDPDNAKQIIYFENIGDALTYFYLVANDEDGEKVAAFVGEKSIFVL